MPLLTDHPPRLGVLATSDLGGHLVAVLEAADLRGRGGAGFPTAAKLASSLGRQPQLIVNACDGEPLVGKDEVLVRYAPGLLADGIALIRAAVQARTVVIAVHRDSATEAMVRALIVAEPDRLRGVSVLRVPGRYVSSEASALVSRLNGREARPTYRTQPLSLGAQDGRSALVLNAETVAQVALSWSGQSPATRLVTVTGSVATYGVLEVDETMTIKEIVSRVGGPVEHPQAVLVGGYGGTWVSWHRAGSASLADLAAAGVPTGAGLLYVLGADCPIRVVGNILSYLAAESAGQCGPCMFGLPAIAADWGELAVPRLAAEARQRLHRRLPVIEGRGACRHPDGAVRMAVSALRTFDGHLAAHVAGRCADLVGATR